jgi:O-antigen biosynthesis protein WbqV
VATGRPGVLVAAPRAVDAEELGVAIHELGQACRAHQPDAALAILRRLVPEYQPSGE